MNKEFSRMAAGRKNVTFVDSYTPFLLPDGTQDGSLFQSDALHLTGAGHEKIVEIVGKALSELKLSGN